MILQLMKKINYGINKSTQAITSISRLIEANTYATTNYLFHYDTMHKTQQLSHPLLILDQRQHLHELTARLL